MKALGKAPKKSAEVGLKYIPRKIILLMNGNRLNRLMGKQHQGEAPTPQIEAIKEIDVPTKLRDVCRFVGLVNYHRDTWHKHVNTLSPLNKLCYTKF